MNFHAGHPTQSAASAAAATLGRHISSSLLLSSAAFSGAQLCHQGLAYDDKSPSQKFPQEKKILHL